MKIIWFKHWGWFYLPISLPDIVITLLALAFWVQGLLAIDRHSPSASDTCFSVFLSFACCFLLFERVAGRTSGRPD